jgi:hypothetical protein
MEHAAAAPRVRLQQGQPVVPVTALVPVELHREAKTEASRRGMSLTEFVAESLRINLAGSQEKTPE